MAAARRATCQSGLALGREVFMYACKIQETANGCWRCAFGEARQAFQVVAQGSFAEHVQVDEQSRASQNGQNQAKRETDEEKAALKESQAYGGAGVLSLCITAITSFNGSELTLLAPVNGWSST